MSLLRDGTSMTPALRLLPATVFAASLLAGACSDTKPKPGANATTEPQVADHTNPAKHVNPAATGLREVTLDVLGMT